MGKLFKNHPHLKVVAAYSLFLFMIPLFILNDYYYATASLFVINSLLIVSLMIIIGYAGQISIAHGAVYGTGAYVSAILSTKYEVPFLVAFICAAIAGFLISLLIGAPSLRLKGHYLAMATLGFGEIIIILFQELDFITGGVNGLTGIKAAQLFGYSFVRLPDYYALVSVIAVLILSFLALFVDSRFGRALRAIKSSEVASTVLGLNPTYYKLLAFAVAGAVAGACGSLYAHLDRFISPSSFSVSLSVMLVAMVMVGGEESFSGALVSALIFSLLNEYVRQFQEMSQMVFGAGLFIAAIYFRGGLLPSITRFLSETRKSIGGQVASRGSER